MLTFDNVIISFQEWHLSQMKDDRMRAQGGLRILLPAFLAVAYLAGMQMRILGVMCLALIFLVVKMGYMHIEILFRILTPA